MVAIGIDLGGTQIKGVAIDTSGQLIHKCLLPTHDGQAEAWKNAVKLAVHELKENVNTSEVAVGLSAPGLPNEQNTAIAFMPGRLQGLENFSWFDFLGQPACVVNDAVAAMAAELHFGAAAGARHAVMLTLGTGVGGAICIDGKIYQGAFSKAGHFGHMVIDHEGEPDITGMPGSLEDCIGNCTLQARSGGRFTSTQELLQAYRQGDTLAQQVWLKSVRQLALGLASITNILSPETIVLGGGITEAGEDLFRPLEEFMARFEWRAGGRKASLVKATFGEMAGAIGAASFALGKNQ